MGKTHVKRIFVAIDISDDVRRLAAGYIECLRRCVPVRAVSWVNAAKLHLTLRFVGECDDDELRIITERVAAIAATRQPFRIAIVDTGVFPSVREPRVLWLGGRDEENALASITSGIEPRETKKGVVKKNQIFTPHLTIGRIKDPKKCREIVTRHLASTFESKEFIVSKIVIYESVLHPKGSIYRILSGHPLGCV